MAFERRCLPLAWRCDAPEAWPEGQVALVTPLLEPSQAVLPPDVPVLLEVDRGIGTSPALVRSVPALGWHSLFRVQGMTHFQSDQQGETEIQTLTTRGGSPYAGSGQVFKSEGWLDAQGRVIWDAPYEEPWCLISDLPQLNGREYAQRNWQEQAFRALKAGGWQWDTAQVWRPDHADRLLLVLSLAYALTLSRGLRWREEPDLRAPVRRGVRQRYRWFRLGLRLLTTLQRLGEPVRFWLNFRLPPSFQSFLARFAC